MATEKKCELNHQIAELKSKSMEHVAAKFASALANGAVRILPGPAEIMLARRVVS